MAFTFVNLSVIVLFAIRRREIRTPSEIFRNLILPALGVAATLIGLGAETWLRGPQFKTREIFIVGFSIFFAYGLAHVDERFYATLPRLMSMVCQNPLITVIICGIALEQLVFRQARAKTGAKE